MERVYRLSCLKRPQITKKAGSEPQGLSNRLNNAGVLVMGECPCHRISESVEGTTGRSPIQETTNLRKKHLGV